MKILLIALTVFLMSCSNTLKQYGGTTPQFKLEEFFSGPLIAHGMVQNRSGEVLRRFSVEMTGEWEGNKGTLYELFYYDDGEQQERIWYLEKLGPNQYAGTASDVTKDALGFTEGYAFNWKYTLAIPVDGKVWDIDFDDWMYLLDENRLINRAAMKKFGFRVGEVTLWIEKVKEERAVETSAASQ